VVHVAFLTKYRLYLIGLALTIVLGVVIAFLTLAPISSKNVPGSDKLNHLLAFMALAFPLPFAQPRLVWPVILGVSAYGGLIEIIQPLFGRGAEWGDFIADVLGASLGGLLGARCGKWFRRLRIVK
jgi:VanZ family protein